MRNTCTNRTSFLKRRLKSVLRCCEEFSQHAWWKDYYSVTGEKQESVNKTPSQSDRSVAGDSGNVVVRLTPISGHVVGELKRVILILEVSVDTIGGDKEIDQATRKLD
jgi:hypothetical protein